MQGKPSSVQRHLVLVAAHPRQVDEPLQRSLDAMRAELARRWTVQALARLSGMSRPVYARKFGEALGESPLRFLTRQRMQRAAQLLRDSELGLAQIGEQVGYVSEFAFNRAFKRHFLIAPGAYRRSLRAASTPMLRAA